MQTISFPFFAAPASIITSAIPSDAKAILLYMLYRQGVPGWKMQKSDVCKTLGLSLYAVKQGLRWLLKAGYATYTRTKFQFTKWEFFVEPIPSNNHQVEIPTVDQVEIQPVLEYKNNSINKETTTHRCRRRNQKMLWWFLTLN